MTLDLPALRKLYDAAAKQEAKHGSMVPMSHDSKALFDALTPVIPALIRAAEERDALLAACGAKDDLLACYRLGKRPSEALFKRLDKANEAIRRAKETP